MYAGRFEDGHTAANQQPLTTANPQQVNKQQVVMVLCAPKEK